MRERVVEKAGGVPVVTLVAVLAVVLYSLWGASLLTYQQEVRAQTPSAMAHAAADVR